MKYLGILISIGLIIAGLSGDFTLRGTDSSIALVAVGIAYLIYDLVNLSGQDDEQKLDEQTEQDNEQEFLDCLEAADNNDVDSQISLGSKYYYGIDIVQDFEQAALWFRKAAESNNAEAQSWLGFMYYNGEGVEQDYHQSAMWFKKAADQNNAEAQYNLGVMYQEGLGVEQNNDQAAYWFHMAADQKYDLAKERLDQLFNDNQIEPVL